MICIPIIRCRNMAESLRFYTGTLDFAILYPGASGADAVVDLVLEKMVIQLSTIDGLCGNPVNIRTNDVDSRFKKYISRGLDTSPFTNSPVHLGPLNQTWGIREFYVTDPDGNTLRFGMPL